MAPELSPLNERFVTQAIAAGLFPSREALLDQAVAALRATLRETTVEPAPAPTRTGGTLPFDDTYGGPLVEDAYADDGALAGELHGTRAWDSDAVLRRIFESLAEAGVRTND